MLIFNSELTLLRKIRLVIRRCRRAKSEAFAEVETVSPKDNLPKFTPL